MCVWKYVLIDLDQGYVEVQHPWQVEQAGDGPAGVRARRERTQRLRGLRRRWDHIRGGARQH